MGQGLRVEKAKRIGGTGDQRVARGRSKLILNPLYSCLCVYLDV